MNEDNLRENLSELLRGGSAFVTVERALAHLKRENRNKQAGKGLHTVWQEIEHMRIGQEDILRFTVDPDWESPEWPTGYWPREDDKVTEEMWKETISDFMADKEELLNLVQNKNIDLTAEIPHGSGQTYLREIILAAQHNAYHTGQIIIIRKALGDWD